MTTNATQPQQTYDDLLKEIDFLRLQNEALIKEKDALRRQIKELVE